MGRGLPSWQKYRAFGPLYEEIRLAEHAARLGSILTFDRRGDVVWFDDFEAGLVHWRDSGDGSSRSADPSAKAARNGLLSARLWTGTGSGKEEYIYHYHPKPVYAKIGLEASFAFDSDLGLFVSELRVYDGVTLLNPQVRYDPVNDKLEYSDDIDSWADLETSVKAYYDPTLFNTLKMVVDLDALEYIRCIFNDVEYPMSGKALPSVGSPGAPSVTIRLHAFTADSTGSECFVDDVILTQNEV